MTFYTDKDLKSKYFRWKKGYIWAKDVESQSQKKFQIVKAYFFRSPLFR